MSRDFKALKDAMIRAVLEPEAQTDRMRALQAICAQCDSPIEKDLAAALLDCRDLHGGESVSVHTPDTSIAGDSDVMICPQYAIGRFRVDFAIMRSTGRRLVVECDGIEFHDRTNMQFIAERQRERDILIAGWPTMRFAGAEIARDPDTCAKQIAAYLSGRGA